MAYKQLYNLPPLRGTTVVHGGTTQPTPVLSVAVSSQRVATLSGLPTGAAATDYEYQFRPAPTVNAQRVADMSQTLAAGESATDYEFQIR